MDKVRLLSVKTGCCVDCHRPVTLDALIKKPKSEFYHCVDCHSEDLFKETYDNKPFPILNGKVDIKENKIKKLVAWCFG